MPSPLWLAGEVFHLATCGRDFWDEKHAQSRSEENGEKMVQVWVTLRARWESLVLQGPQFS